MMANIRNGLHQVLMGFLGICAAVGSLFALALLASAIDGRDTPSSFLLGGFGFLLLVLSLAVLVYAIRQWALAKPSREG